VVLPEASKQHQTAHFSVRAHNDLVATRVADVLEYHYPRLAGWLGLPTAARWTPRLEVHVHPTQARMLAATQAVGTPRLVVRVTYEDEQVSGRTLDVHQTDPWL